MHIVCSSAGAAGGAITTSSLEMVIGKDGIAIVLEGEGGTDAIAVTTRRPGVAASRAERRARRREGQVRK